METNTRYCRQYTWIKNNKNLLGLIQETIRKLDSQAEENECAKSKYKK